MLAEEIFYPARPYLFPAAAFGVTYTVARAHTLPPTYLLHLPPRLTVPHRALCLPASFLRCAWVRVHDCYHHGTLLPRLWPHPACGLVRPNECGGDGCYRALEPSRRYLARGVCQHSASRLRYISHRWNVCSSKFALTGTLPFMTATKCLQYLMTLYLTYGGRPGT